MKCPHCKKETNSPSERELLCWVYIYLWGMSHKETAKQMGVSVNATKHFILNLRKKWPTLVPMNRAGRPRIFNYNSEMHSDPKIQF